MKPLYLEFVNSGIANRFDKGDHEIIEMNWRVTLYPELFYGVLMHEVNHREGKFNGDDLIHDMKSRTPGLFKFMRKHLSAWTQLIPIYYDKNKKLFIYDWNAIVSWFILLLSVYGTYVIVGWMF